MKTYMVAIFSACLVALGLVVALLVGLVTPSRAGGWGMEIDPATAERICADPVLGQWCVTQAQWSRCWVRDCSDAAPPPIPVPNKTTTWSTLCLGVQCGPQVACIGCAPCPDGYELVMRHDFRRACARDLQEPR